ncbi:MAG: polysaccharide pyruvyl transferase family protein [Clostridiales bacterium]|jgi:hypothetical protein|nr:polysaccharide pyruvyl transferase family protein [Clostridiales bacterium]
MRRIGILTFHRACNYGAALQAYALYSVVRKLLADDTAVEVVDYLCDHLESVYNPFRLPDQSGRFALIKKTIRFALHYREKSFSLKAFQKFRKKYLLLSKQYSLSDIERSVNNYDMFIVGSDQIWNMDLTKGDATYFLNFETAKTKKCSYAASFGSPLSFQEHSSEIVSYLNDFCEVSLREKIGVNVLSKSLRCPIHTDLDPTLLLRRHDWEVISSESASNFRGKYILLYIVAPPKDLIEFAKELELITGYKVVMLCNSFKIGRGFKRLRRQTPADFINLVANAEVVLTTSFHGLAFSIIFHRKFVVEVQSTDSTNYRIESLLQALGLEDRILTESSLKSYHSSIDWLRIDDLLNDERQKSISYLRSITSFNRRK